VIKIMQPAEAQDDKGINHRYLWYIHQTIDAKEQPVILYLIYLIYQECLKICVKGGQLIGGFVSSSFLREANLSLASATHWLLGNSSINFLK